MTIRYHVGLHVDANLSDRKRAENVATVSAILAESARTGRRFEPPPGRLEMLGTVRGVNGGCTWGHGNLGEDDDGRFGGTEFVFYNETEPAVDLSGSDNTISDRMQCQWRGVTLRHGDPKKSRGRAVEISWGMRAEPMLDQVTIKDFGHHGVWFDGQLWQSSFRNLRIDHCGHAVEGSSGISKDPAVDCTVWNANDFIDLTVENCGNDSSEAGGIDLDNVTTNRSLAFAGRLTLQSNRGRAQMRLRRFADVNIDRIYCEHLLNPNWPTAILIDQCSGSLRSAMMAIETVSFLGTRIAAGSRVIENIDTRRIVVGMEVEGPGIPDRPSPTVESVGDGRITITQPATADVPSAEVRLRLMGTSGMAIVDSPDFTNGLVTAPPRTWAQAVARRSTSGA